jgi:glutamine synthetase
MNKHQIADYLKQKDINKIKFAFADIDGVLRGKLINSDKFLDGLKDGYGFCDVVFGWDSSDTCYDNVKLTGWHTGYPDKYCYVDTETLRVIPWENDVTFFLADFTQPDGSSLYACPRSLLRKIARQCEEMGYQTKFAQEFEWFNFTETSESLHEKNFIRLNTLSKGMFGYSVLRPSRHSAYYYDLFNLLNDFNVPLEGLHTETGPGVYEAAIQHDHVLAAADKATLFKTAVKEIALKHTIMATFMAKWNADLPGCSGHIHQSLWNQDKTENLFHDENDANRMSDLHKHYLAGQLYCLPHILPMYAPTINSYKRLVEGAWAPTTITWGMDNRTTAIRIVNDTPKHNRLELRVPGADVNPYLAMAAALASGLYGIKHQLPLTIKPTVGNGYQDVSNGHLHSNLYEAATAMQNSAIANELFGEKFVQHFTNTRLWEWRQFSKQVTDWELKRYLEII